MIELKSRHHGDHGGSVQLHRGAHAHLQTGEDDRGHTRELGQDYLLILLTN